MIGRTPEDELQRFWKKVRLDESTGCWIWTASLTVHGGYGQFTLYKNGPNLKAHNYAYEQLIGPIPKGLQLDHLCRNRACVNPAHLEPVTPRINILRGLSPVAENMRKTHCNLGHEYSFENTRINKYGYRICRACQRFYTKQHLLKKQLVVDSLISFGASL